MSLSTVGYPALMGAQLSKIIMPHYAAALLGRKDILEDIAQCFTTALVTIRLRRELEWIMESSNFELCQSDEQVYTKAKALVSQIHQLLGLYLGLYYKPLSISSIMILNDDDEVIRRRIYATMEVRVHLRATRTFNPTASGSVATDVLSGAFDDPAITEALSLVGDETPTWARVYDIIKFLGDEGSIAKSGLAPRHDTRRVRQTANHYRHLGSPKKHPLPLNPPTLSEAALFATDLLKKWIANRI